MSWESDQQFQSNEYDRPNQTWVCGREAAGMPCPLGPTHQGQCRAVCVPRREGDRYYCNNASVLAGVCDEGPLPDGSCSHTPSQCRPSKRAGAWICNRGACQEGPLPDGRCSQKFEPCRPVRSVMARRRIATTAVFALAVGGLLILTNTPQRQAIVSPGPLTSPHRTVARCEDCHRAGQGDLTQWVHAAFARETDRAQNAQCLDCHAAIGPTPQFAHGVPPRRLARLRTVDPHGAPDSPSLLLALARNGRPAANEELACATCHQEHRGGDFDLTHMSDLQCHVCHSATFHSFHDGHPEFSSYPYSRRTQIHFDHATHYGIHFSNFQRTTPQGMAPLDPQLRGETSSDSCAHCHQLDPGGNAFLVTDFSQSCGSCHSKQITNSPVDFVHIPVPLLTADTAADAKQAVDEFARMAWFEKYETGFMRLLSAQDSKHQAAKQTLLSWRNAIRRAEADGTRDDTVDSPPPHVYLAARQYVNGLRELLQQLLGRDNDAVAARLEAAAVAETARDESAHLAATLILDLSLDHRRALEELIARRLPSIPTENGDEGTREESDGVGPPDAGLAEGATEAARSDADGFDRTQGVTGSGTGPSLRQWNLHSDDRVWTLTYRPAGHADQLLRRFLASGARHCDTKSLNAFIHGETISPWEQLFAELSRPAAPGRCMKCHTADEDPDGHIEIAWSARGGRRFTDFVHAPHLPPLQNENCEGCHRLIEPSADTINLFRPEFTHQENTINTNPFSAETSGFVPLEKSSCSNCHQPSMAGESCLTCHNYHVTAPLPSTAADPLDPQVQ